MDVSIFLAKAFSIYFLVIGMAVIVRRKKFQEIFADFFTNKANIFFMALVALILGILLVVAHPAFTKDWRSVITVLAWLTLIKGIVHIFVPETLMLFKQRILTYAVTYYIAGIVCLILAVYLGYHGFFA